MTKFRKNHPILVCILFFVFFVLSSVLSALVWALVPGLSTGDVLLYELVSEATMLVLLLALAWFFGIRRHFRSRQLGFWRNLLPGLAIWILYLYSALGTALLSMEDPGFGLRTPLEILTFALCMLTVGFTEELVFRAIMVRVLAARYGRTAIGVWVSVTVSSLLFGAVHLLNAAGGAATISGVLIQMVGTAALGLCFAAIYLRTRSYLTVALLHGFMDFCALSRVGIFGLGTMADSISGYTPAMLISTGLYTLLALFLLRPSQMKKITVPGAKAPEGHLIVLMMAVMLLAGLLSAVTVLVV